MKLSLFFRRFHFWLSIFVLIPALIVIGSGLLLQVKKESDWVQPATKMGSLSFSEAMRIEKLTTVDWFELLQILRSIPESDIKSWDDVSRIDVRHQQGIVKVTSHQLQEYQIDMFTGELLSLATRRSDLIESIHDGSFFHENARLGLFFPAALLLLLLAVSGGYLFFITLRNKRRSKKRKLGRL